MDYIAFLLPVLFHRIGLILSFVGIFMLVVLPNIFSQEEDKMFAIRVYRILILIVRIGLIIIFITGLIRLRSGIPDGFLPKAFFATITILMGIVYSPEYGSSRYIRYFGVLLTLLSITALVGIYL